MLHPQTQKYLTQMFAKDSESQRSCLIDHQTQVLVWIKVKQLVPLVSILNKEFLVITTDAPLNTPTI